MAQSAKIAACEGARMMLATGFEEGLDMIERKVTRHTVSLLGALPGTEPEPMAAAWHLPTGAKLYHRADGYFVSGYAADGSDVRDVLRLVGRKGRAVPMVGQAR